MSEQGIKQAEERVREMNRMAQLYSEQGNLFLRRQNLQSQLQQLQQQSSGSVPQTQQENRTQQTEPRFEPMAPLPGEAFAEAPEESPPPGLPERPPDAHQKRDTRNVPAVKKSPVSPPASGLSGLIDNEKLLIVLIMYILISEKADIKLILALGYLLL